MALEGCLHWSGKFLWVSEVLYLERCLLIGTKFEYLSIAMHVDTLQLDYKATVI